MPRGSSSSRSSSSLSSRPYSTNIPPQAPKPQTQPVQSQPVQSQIQTQSQSGSFFGSMVSGFGFGAGSSIAHSVFGGSSSTPTQSVLPTPIVNENKTNCSIDCNKLVKEYLQCIELTSADHCSNIFDDYKKKCV